MQKIEIEQIIDNAVDPSSSKSLAELHAVHDLELSGNELKLQLIFPYPAADLQAFWQAEIAALLPDLSCAVVVTHKLRRHQCSTKIASHPRVKNIIAIASCKGGVGKSTTTLGLAHALLAQGARVGILDADIYGPNIPDLLRISGSAAIKDKQFQPVVVNGLHTMSIAYCMDNDKPAIWRGPMVSGALEQLYKQTNWPQLDYLLIDLPPGTGDIQLTLSKKIPLAGVVMVSTAETLALVDTIKGIEMFNKVGVNTLGLIENMANHTCAKCGHAAPIFGQGGVAAVAERYDLQVLDHVEFHGQLQEKADPEFMRHVYKQAARQMAVALGLQAPTYRVQFADVATTTGGNGVNKS